MSVTYPHLRNAYITLSLFILSGNDLDIYGVSTGKGWMEVDANFVKLKITMELKL